MKVHKQPNPIYEKFEKKFVKHMEGILHAINDAVSQSVKEERKRIKRKLIKTNILDIELEKIIDEL